MKKKIPPLEYGLPREPMPIPEWDYTPEVFKDPKGLEIPAEVKNTTLHNLEQAYQNAWIQNKVAEIAYQRLLHDYTDSSGLVKDKLSMEIARVQNELTLCRAMLEVLKDWQTNYHK